MTANIELHTGDEPEHLFPKLSENQIARLKQIGIERSVRRGEVLVEVGTVQPSLFVLEQGSIVITSVCDDEEETVRILEPGQFTGEATMLSRQPSLTRVRASEDGSVVELTHACVQKLVTDDPELSETLMRAFILRRMALVSRGLGRIAVLGSRYSADTLRIRQFLGRNAQPYTYVDVDRDEHVGAVLERFHVKADDVPIVIRSDVKIVKNPSNAELAEYLGLNLEIDEGVVHDVVVVGAGPAGLAAAVYGASEGLDVLVLETNAPGGQAGTSSKIENYLGFPAGISGEMLAAQAYAQAQKFGAQIQVARQVVRLDCSRAPYAVVLSDGHRVCGRAIIIATGVRYRKLAIAELGRYEGVGVYYAATRMEAQLCRDEEVIVVGGGNSAGQAAVFLSSLARRVHVVVRGRGLAESMSRYLIQRIEVMPNITLRPFTQVRALEGAKALERVELHDAQSDARSWVPVRHVFMMTGAEPNTAWLRGCVALDQWGFVRTDRDLVDTDLTQWSASRSPHFLETNVPGVFAVGDVRSGSIKRVASAVGEGSMSIQVVHQTLSGS